MTRVNPTNPAANAGGNAAPVDLSRDQISSIDGSQHKAKKTGAILRTYDDSFKTDDSFSVQAPWYRNKREVVRGNKDPKMMRAAKHGFSGTAHFFNRAQKSR